MYKQFKLQGVFKENYTSIHIRIGLRSKSGVFLSCQSLFLLFRLASLFGKISYIPNQGDLNAFEKNSYFKTFHGENKERNPERA